MTAPFILSRACLQELTAADLTTAELQKAMPECEQVSARATTYCIEQLRQQRFVIRANPGQRPARYSITRDGHNHLQQPAKTGRPRGRLRFNTTGAAPHPHIVNSVFSLGMAEGTQ